MIKEQKEKVLAVIPARGGSKSLPRKNLCDLAGKPLIAWSIEAAKNSNYVDRVIVSTDDDEIAQVSKIFGADVPFIRPGHLADDTALTEDVLLHAINWLEEVQQETYEILLCLQPTDPFRKNGIIDEVISTLISNKDLDTVFAAYPDHKNYWTKKDDRFVRLDDRGHLPRSVKKHVYREDTGIACATRIHVVKEQKRIGKKACIIPHETIGSCIDIHTAVDLFLANQIVKRYGILPNISEIHESSGV